MAMTSRERVLAVLGGDIPDRVPYVENGIDIPIMCRLLNREVPDRPFEAGEFETPSLEYQLALNRLLRRDNVKYDMRPVIPALRVPGRDQILFYHEGHLKTRNDLDQLVLPDLGSEAVRAPIREFMAGRGEYAAILSTRVGISASYLAMGMEHFYTSLKDDPQLVSAVVHRYAEWSAQSVYLAKEMGFDAIWTSDDVAYKSGPLWSPRLFSEIIWPHVRLFAKAVRDADIPWIFHSDGDLRALLPDLVGFGIAALNPIEPACMDIRAIREAFPRLVLIGNVDVDLLTRGTPEQVRDAVRWLMRNVAPAGRYCAASGNSIASYCDMDNVLAMTGAIQDFGAYPIAA